MFTKIEKNLASLVACISLITLITHLNPFYTKLTQISVSNQTDSFLFSQAAQLKFQLKLNFKFLKCLFLS